jgi:hypothetical protein
VSDIDDGAGLPVTGLGDAIGQEINFDFDIDIDIKELPQFYLFQLSRSRSNGRPYRVWRRRKPKGNGEARQRPIDRRPLQGGTP